MPAMRYDLTTCVSHYLFESVVQALAPGSIDSAIDGAWGLGFVGLEDAVFTGARRAETPRGETGGRTFIPFTEIAFSEKSIVDACHPKARCGGYNEYRSLQRLQLVHKSAQVLILCSRLSPSKITTT